MKKLVSVGVVVSLSVIFTPLMSMAQGTSAASITGVVRDESGGVLPGVTIELSSPVLIEKVRSTVSDSDGAYRIAELRPGTFVVTFSLQGFSALRREGIELSPSFTATINVVLKVGSLQETITVSGQTPLIDTSTLTQQKTITRELLTAVPTSQSALGIASLMPSVVQPPNAQDVGGSMGERSVRISIHGSKTSDARLRQEGMVYNALTPGGNFGTTGLEGTGRGYYVNPLAASEIVIDAGTNGLGGVRRGRRAVERHLQGWRKRLQRCSVRGVDRPPVAVGQPDRRVEGSGLEPGQHAPEDLRRQLHSGRAHRKRPRLVLWSRQDLGS